jgi:antitoxin CptB
MRDKAPHAGRKALRSNDVSETEATRHARLRMRSWRRGTREMDLILGPFADADLAGLGPADLDAYEALLSENDPDLYLWMSGRAEAPPALAVMVARIRRARGIG